MYPSFIPIARGRVRWLPPMQGGRLSLPAGPVYAATAGFGDGAPGQYDEQLSIVLRFRQGTASYHDSDVEIDFLARDVALTRIHPGSTLTVFEGRRPVAKVRVTDVGPAKSHR